MRQVTGWAAHAPGAPPRSCPSARRDPRPGDVVVRDCWLPADLAPGDLLGEPVIKVLARHPSRTSADMAQAARHAVGHLVDVTYSAGGGLLECSVRGVTKAHGLERAAAHHGVAPTDVVAFGDMPNDLAMLRWAGHGVAVANAHPDVLHVADEVTASNLDDGVASVLERWF